MSLLSAGERPLKNRKKTQTATMLAFTTRTTQLGTEPIRRRVATTRHIAIREVTLGTRAVTANRPWTSPPLGNPKWPSIQVSTVSTRTSFISM